MSQIINYGKYLISGLKRSASFADEILPYIDEIKVYFKKPKCGFLTNSSVLFFIQSKHHSRGNYFKYVTRFSRAINPNQPGGWHNVPRKLDLSLVLLAIVDPDGNQTIFSRALLDADFGPVGRNQHPARLRERTLN